MIGCIVNGELGKELEKAFRCMYDGGCKYAQVVFRLMVIFDRLAKGGMITNGTYKRLENLLVKAAAVNSFVIESCNSAEIVMVNTDTHTKEFLDLSGYIEWIVAELLYDPLLCELLHGKNDYASIIAAFDGYEKYAKNKKHRKNTIKVIEHSIDYFVLNDSVIYTVKDEESIIMRSIPYEKEMQYFLVELKEGEIDTSDLLDGRIYSLAYLVIAVNLVDNRFIIIDILKRKRIMHEGKISHVFYDKALFFVIGSCLGIIDVRTGTKRIISASAKAVCEDRNGLYWNLLNENGRTVSTYYYDLRTNRSKLKTCKKTVWQGFLNLMYDINLEYFNSVSSRLICYELFEDVPVPFTVGNIMKKLAEIERHGYNGTIVHSEKYMDGINYLLSLDGSRDKNKPIADKLSAYVEKVNITKVGYQDTSAVCKNIDYYSKICEQLDIDLWDSKDKPDRDMAANNDCVIYDVNEEDDDSDEPADSVISILDAEIARVQMEGKCDKNKQLIEYIKAEIQKATQPSVPCKPEKPDESNEEGSII